MSNNMKTFLRGVKEGFCTVAGIALVAVVVIAVTTGSHLELVKND